VPHVLGILALYMFVVLLPSIALEVVEISFVETIAIVLTEFQIMLQFFKQGIHSGIGSDVGFTHDISY
jgi:hypothetical protein